MRSSACDNQPTQLTRKIKLLVVYSRIKGTPEYHIALHASLVTLVSVQSQ
ncbi:12438_t:CDS:2, partial [Funneliformis geosporum]